MQGTGVKAFAKRREIFLAYGQQLSPGRIFIIDLFNLVYQEGYRIF
jgi:hypothetical protein